MALKTNYKDDGFTGNRKYRQITNADNTLSFEDVTPYNPVGDSFGAKDINDTNTAINEIQTPDFEDYESGASVPDAEAALIAIKKKVDVQTLLKNIKAVLKGAFLKKYILTTMEQVMANTLAGRIADARLLKEVNHDLGDMTGITNNTYNTVAKLLQHYIDSGYLPDVNSVALVPILSGANSRILTDGDNSSYPAWYAYDNNVSTKFIPSAGASRYIGFDFQSPVLVKRIEWRGADSAYPGFSDQAKLQASADGKNWVVIKNLVGGSTYGQDMFVNVTGATKYRYWRVLDNIRFGIVYLQFYGRQ